MSTTPLRTLKSARPSRDTAQGSTFIVSVVEGPDAGASFMLDASSSRMLIGQSPVCAIRLRDPEVSRRHTALMVDGDRLSILDLGSTNGTSVNGVVVEEAFLHGGEPGDELAQGRPLRRPRDAFARQRRHPREAHRALRTGSRRLPLHR